MGSDRLIGILALQGDFAEHEAAMQRCGFGTRLVRDPAALRGVDAIVLPGGESSTMLRLLDVEGLWRPLGDALRSGVPVHATCAGLILLAHDVDPVQRTYDLLPISVVRNGYGRQYHSGTVQLESEVLPEGTVGTFIRAPRITRSGGCEVLARRGADPVLVRKGPILASCFHPELETDHAVTRMFATIVRAHGARTANEAGA